MLNTDKKTSMRGQKTSMWGHHLLLAHFLCLIPFEEEWAEQGFLNAVYKSSWGSMPARMALNMAFWDMGTDIWNTYAKEAQAIHFTMMKPWTWQCTWSQYAPLCYLFWHEEALRFHEVRL